MLVHLTSVLHCMRYAHDGRLVLLAGVVCAAGIYASFALGQHAARAVGKTRARWGLVSIVASGCTAWATHFIVLLAFRPDMPAAFEPVLTATSLLCAIGGIGAGITVSIRARRRRIHFLSGIIVGLGIATLHYVGQYAYLVRGQVSWNLWLVIPSIIVSIPISGLAMIAVAERDPRARRWAAPLLLTSIAVLHFCGMAALTLRFDPAARFPEHAVSPEAITPVVVGVSVILIALAVLGWRFDLAAKARLRQDRRRLRELADVALEGLLICSDDMIVTANDSVERLSGYSPGLLTGVAIGAILPGIDIADLPEREEREAELHTGNGTIVPVRILRREVVLGHRLQTVVAVRDQRERLRTEDRIRTLAFHDSLTGLPNRARFFDLLALQFSSRRLADQAFAVLMIDLDRFKPINDMHGHAAGDAVLTLVAERLRSVVRADDVVARLGGDEFAILQLGQAEGGDAEQLAGRVVKVIAQPPFAIDGLSFQLGTSVGIATAPKDGQDPAELISHADLALYAAKAAGKGTFRCYDIELDAVMQRRRVLETGLRRAIVEQRLEIHYQPLVDAKSGRITSAEALVRWNEPGQGYIPPSDFIGIAEETGLIVPLGGWVLRTACLEAASWPDDIGVAVNLSPVQFREPNIIAMVSAALSASALRPDRLELEITEGVLLDDEVRTLEVLNGLRSIGVKLAMDDFGTGYSSLSYLRKFPFDKIKIDQSFIRMLPGDAEGAAIVRAMIALGRCLGMSVTVEGVETTAQYEFSVAEGCSTIQGYLISRPLARPAFDAFVAARADTHMAA